MSNQSQWYDQQAALWNGRAGLAWTEHQPLLDQVLAPFAEILLAEVPAGFEGRVLDIGCGTGTTTLAIAKKLGAKGSVVGLDVSEPMIRLAGTRAQAEGSKASFVKADAQTHPFAEGAFDLFVSRFGVMFFGDFVAAFANLRRSATRGAALRCIAWRTGAENPFMTAAERAVAPLLPELPIRRADGPGQFAFGDRARVETILEASGWSEIELRPVNVTCTFAEKDLETYFTRFGPLGLVLQDASDEMRAKLISTARRAFDPFVHGSEVRFDGAVWLVRARA